MKFVNKMKKLWKKQRQTGNVEKRLRELQSKSYEKLKAILEKNLDETPD